MQVWNPKLIIIAVLRW